jgi:hypothetical protein
LENGIAHVAFFAESAEELLVVCVAVDGCGFVEGAFFGGAHKGSDGCWDARYCSGGRWDFFYIDAG